MKLFERKVVAEFLGTFLLVFAGCGAVMVAERLSVPSLNQWVPVVFGLVVAAMVYAIGHISGCHINPAVTVGFAVARQFPKSQIPPYLLAQFLGSVGAMYLLAILLPSGYEFGATVPAVSPIQALSWEFLLTFCLMFVVMAVATDTRAPAAMAGAVVGATVALAALVGGPVTGASMNPARSFGPAIFQESLDSFWIYLVGPILGAVCAARVYEWIRCDPQNLSKTQDSAQGCC